MTEDLHKQVEHLQAKVIRLETALGFSHHPLCNFWHLAVGKGGGCSCAVYHHSEMQHLLKEAAEQGRKEALEKIALVPPQNPNNIQAPTLYQE